MTTVATVQSTVTADLDTLRGIAARWRELADQLRQEDAPAVANAFGRVHTLPGWTADNLDFARGLLETFIGEAPAFILCDQEEHLMEETAKENAFHAELVARTAAVS